MMYKSTCVRVNFQFVIQILTFLHALHSHSKQKMGQQWKLRVLLTACWKLYLVVEGFVLEYSQTLRQGRKKKQKPELET